MKVLSPRDSPAVIPWFERPDPFWDVRLWAASSIGWRSWVATSRKQLALAAENPGKFADKVDKTVVPSLLKSDTALRVLGVLAQHHICSEAQLAAFTGASERTIRVIVSRMWKAGMLDQGKLLAHPGVKYPYLWRVRAVLLDKAHQVQEISRFLGHLPYHEWVAVTGGKPLGRPRGSKGGRHELLVAELGLRLAEILPRSVCAAVAGEHLAAGTLLTVGTPAAHASTGRQGDLVMVREDGLRVVFEVVRTVTGLDAKVAGWCKLLAAGTPDSVGVMFVVVDARNREDVSAYRDRPLRLIEKGLEAAGRDGVLARSRVGYACWSTDWFPARGRSTDLFERLEVRTHVAGDTWEPLQVASLPFAPLDPKWWSVAAKNVNLLAGSPAWLRSVAGPATFGRLDRPEALRDWFAAR